MKFLINIEFEHLLQDYPHSYHNKPLHYAKKESLRHLELD